MLKKLSELLNYSPVSISLSKKDKLITISIHTVNKDLKASPVHATGTIEEIEQGFDDIIDKMNEVFEGYFVDVESFKASMKENAEKDANKKKSGTPAKKEMKLVIPDDVKAAFDSADELVKKNFVNEACSKLEIFNKSVKNAASKKLVTEKIAQIKKDQMAKMTAALDNVPKKDPGIQNTITPNPAALENVDEVIEDFDPEDTEFIDEENVF